MPVPDQEQSMGGREWALLLALSVLWGGSFYFFKILVAELPPFTIVLGRVGLAALVLNLFLLIRRDPMSGSIRLWGAFAVMGLLNNVIPFTLIAYAETGISSGLASILNATTPILTVLVAHALTKVEKLTWSKGLGVVLGFLGVIILVGPNVLLGLDGGDDIRFKVAGLLAALSYAFGGVFGRRFRGQAPIKTTTGNLTASTLMLIPITLFFDHPWDLAMPSAPVWAAWVGLALPSTALAFLMFFRIMAKAGATNTVLVTFLVPISALMLGAVLLGETVTSQAIGGMVLIGLGLAAIDGRLWRAAASLGRPPKKAGDQVS